MAFSEAPEVIRPDANITVDFVTKETGAIYQLAEIPKTDFRFECHSLRLDSFKDIKSSMTVSLYGTNKAEHALLVKHEIAVSYERSKAFTTVFKQPG